MKRCSIDGCERPVCARGWCRNHYGRWYNTGDPLGSKRLSWEQRVMSKVLKQPDGCWLWQGTRNPQGYGTITAEGDSNRRLMAHRATWQLLRGELNPNLELDHLCRVPLCVNPEHLEPVTRQVNMERSRPWRAHWNMTHCKRGHEFTPENTYVTTQGGRACRACLRYRRALKSSGKGIVRP